MGRIIDVSMRKLDKDADNMKTKLNDLDSEVRRMEESIEEMSSMWQGPAHNAFVEQFNQDKQAFMDLSSAISDFITKVKDAADRYDKCEDDCKSAVASIRVE